jgi:hypothetical protein
MTVRASFEFSSAGEAIPAPAVQYLIDQVIRYSVVTGDEAVAVLAFQDLKFRRSNIRHNGSLFLFAPLNWPQRLGGAGQPDRISFLGWFR